MVSMRSDILTSSVLEGAHCQSYPRREGRRGQAKAGNVLEAANIGIVRPPWVYLGAGAVGLLLHLLRPVRLVPPLLSVPLGGSIVLVAVALFLSAVRAFQTAGTPVPGNRPTTTIVRTGPYRFSR